MRYVCLLMAISSVCVAQTQTIRVYSELTRIGPDGNVVPADRGAPPRTILSPGIIRGAWSSFRIVVHPPAPGRIILDVGQNPANAVKATLYREQFDSNGIPDALTEVKMPYESVMASEKRVLTFWLDLWVPKNAPVDRIKVEPQLWYNDDWFTYPMEVRILTPVLGEVKTRNGPLPDPSERSDAAVLGPLKAAFCGVAEPSAPNPAMLTTRQLLRRNAFQHLALAGTKDRLRAALSNAGAVALCTEPPPAAGPEWYLRFRDQLFGKEQ